MGVLKAGGLSWNLEVWGVRSAVPPVLFLHGFTGRAAGWRTFASRFESKRLCYAPDLPGHGSTGAPPPGFGLVEAAGAIRGICEVLAVRSAAVVGYSMGGRIALHLALAAPRLVDRLVLVGASPGIEDASERAARRDADDAWARRIEEDYEAFVGAWLAQPIFAEGPALLPERREALRREKLSHDPAGLAAALRAFSVAEQAPLHPALETVTAPVLWVAGEMDAKYRAIAESMAARMPHAEARIIAGAGHAPHLDTPDRFLSAIAPFLEG